MKIVWSPLAVEQARNIASYIALDNLAAAEGWIDQIFSCIERLQEFPESGRIVPEISRRDVREIVQGNYRVIYRLGRTEIKVLVVKSYRQKLKSEDVERE